VLDGAAEVATVRRGDGESERPVTTVCSCGANVVVGETDSGETVVLESFSSYAGDGRYRVVDFDQAPWLVEPVPPTHPVGAYPDHRPVCPRA
jgi:hypothetical protein